MFLSINKSFIVMFFHVTCVILFSYKNEDKGHSGMNRESPQSSENFHFLEYIFVYIGCECLSNPINSLNKMVPIEILKKNSLLCESLSSSKNSKRMFP